MNIKEAKSQILDLLHIDLDESEYKGIIDKTPSDYKDIGKFLLLNKPARVIHRYNGWNIPINLDWFAGIDKFPIINNESFYWYAFAIPQYAGFRSKHYYICDYLQIKTWVEDFHAPLGIDHQDQRYWRANFKLYSPQSSEELGYFFWGDEKIQNQENNSRIIKLDNIQDIVDSYVGKNYYIREKINKESEYYEGEEKSIKINTYERDPEAREKCIELFGAKCIICGFDFSEMYGEIGQGYIHVHHIIPLSEIGKTYKVNPVTDLIPICPNCHAMIHMKDPVYTVDELKYLINISNSK